jgi:hypothetical protein
MKPDQFLWIRSVESSINFVNVDHIVRVTAGDGGSIVLHLSHGPSVTIHGDGRLELLKLVTSHSMLLNGEKPNEEGLRDAWKRIDAEVKSGS